MKQWSKGNKTRALALLLAFGMLLGLAGCAGGKTGGGKTPEETMAMFLDALKDQDLDTMLECCDIEYIDRVDFQKYTERTGVLFLDYIWGDAALLRETAVAARRGNYARNIQTLTASLLLLGEGEYQTEWANLVQVQSVPVRKDPQILDEFMSKMDPERLKKLEVAPVTVYDMEIEGIERILDRVVAEGKTSEEKAQKYAEQMMTNLAAEDVVEMAVPLTLGDKKFIKTFTLVKVAGRWKINSFYANMAALDDEMIGAAMLIED